MIIYGVITEINLLQTDFSLTLWLYCMSVCISVCLFLRPTPCVSVYVCVGEWIMSGWITSIQINFDWHVKGTPAFNILSFLLLELNFLRSLLMSLPNLHAFSFDMVMVYTSLSPDQKAAFQNVYIVFMSLYNCCTTMLLQTLIYLPQRPHFTCVQDLKI